jgi:hypothetical protein
VDSSKTKKVISRKKVDRGDAKMPNKSEKATKQEMLSVTTARYTEYYDMQPLFDELYAKSKNGEVFENLTDMIFSRQNILLAYRNIKSNDGSHTPGTDGKTV